MMRINHTRAASITEVVVATSILMVTILAVFATIAKTRAPVAESDQKLQGAIYGKKVLESLRGELTSNGWVCSVHFTDGIHNASDIYNQLPFSANTQYVITDDVSGADVIGKRVSINVVY